MVYLIPALRSTPMAPETAPPVRRHRHHPLVGTTVEVAVRGASADVAAAVDRAVLDEMVRLEGVFDVFDPSSELSRWARGEVDEVSAELTAVAAAALDWQRRSAGRFNPLAGVLTRRWRQAETDGRVPTDDELAELAAAIAEPRFVVDDGELQRIGDCTDVQFNAFVKGWIVDRALAAGVAACAALSAGGIDLCVNAGGDLAHAGPGSWPVAIENPLRPYDNEPPLTTTSIARQGLATSGRARRGFRVDGEWFAHVLDPRTARPVDALASITVRAADAATADVVATIAGLDAPTEQRPAPWADTPGVPVGVSVFAVTPDGRQWGAEQWGQLGEPGLRPG